MQERLASLQDSSQQYMRCVMGWEYAAKSRPYIDNRPYEHPCAVLSVINTGLGPAQKRHSVAIAAPNKSHAVLFNVMC